MTQEEDFLSDDPLMQRIAKHFQKEVVVVDTLVAHVLRWKQSPEILLLVKTASPATTAK